MEMSDFAKLMEQKYGIRAPETPAPEPQPEKPRIPRTKPNRDENFFMMDLMILKNSLVTRMGSVKERIKKVNRYGWRDLRLLLHLVNKVQAQLIETMPENRFDYYATLARSGSYHLEISGPIRQKRMVIISDSNLAMLCETVMRNECVMWLKTGNEVERCPIRQAMLEVAPPSEIGTGYRCEYEDAASDLINGKEVAI